MSAYHDSEYEIEVFCPNCGNKDVVVDYSLGFFTFQECQKCGFKKGSINRNKVHNF